MEKVERRFSYKYFMFYLDIDEIDIISKQLSLFSHNKFNYFNFRDTDHMVFNKPGVRKNLENFLLKHNEFLRGVLGAFQRSN